MKIALQQQEIYNKQDLETGNYLFVPEISRKLQDLINRTGLRNSKADILDVACHYGYMSKVFPKNWKYQGIDIVKNDNPKIKQGDLSEVWPYKEGEFDVCFCAEILEHIFDTDKFLQEVFRVLKKDGFLLLTTPNTVPLHHRVRTLFFGVRPYSVDFRNAPGAPGHIRAFVKSDLETLLRENGFKIIKIHGKTLDFFPFKYVLADMFPALSTGFLLLAQKA